VFGYFVFSSVGYSDMIVNTVQVIHRKLISEMICDVLMGMVGH